MKYAWIENNYIKDIAHDDPHAIYHPDVAILYNTLVPDEAVNGQGWLNGALQPLPVETPEKPYVPIPQIQTNAIRDVLSLSEKVIWDNDSKPEIKTAKIELGYSSSVVKATPVLQFLVDNNIISQASMTAILALAK